MRTATVSERTPLPSSPSFISRCVAVAGNVKVPSVPIDPQVIAQYQALLKRKFEEIRYITSIRRPEDVLDAAAVWGYVAFRNSSSAAPAQHRAALISLTIARCAYL